MTICCCKRKENALQKSRMTRWIIFIIIYYYYFFFLSFASSEQLNWCGVFSKRLQQVVDAEVGWSNKMLVF